MTLRQTISDALRNVLPARPGIAVIHSSLSGLVAPAEFTRWDALAALDALVRDGWTIALPAFTFSFCGGKAFDVAKSPSEVGVLADWALEGLGYAYRTPHPIYSFVTAGPCAQSLISRQALTTFGEGSAFEYFEQENATIVMLGCDWKYCTQFHRYEELAAVGYRHFKDFAGRAKVIESDEAVTARMYVRDLKIDAENDFSPAVESLREQKAIATSQLWRGKIEAVSARDLAARNCRKIRWPTSKMRRRSATKLVRRSRLNPCHPCGSPCSGIPTLSTCKPHLRGALTSFCQGDVRPSTWYRSANWSRKC
jgi:aminoglycoside N3'-acetyltransferase